MRTHKAMMDLLTRFDEAWAISDPRVVEEVTIRLYADSGELLKTIGLCSSYVFLSECYLDFRGGRNLEASISGAISKDIYLLPDGKKKA